LQWFIINQQGKFEIDESSIIVGCTEWKLLDWKKLLSVIPYYWKNIEQRMEEPESTHDRQAMKNIWCHIGKLIGEVYRDEGLLLMEAIIQKFKIVNRFRKRHPEGLYDEAEDIIENILIEVYGGEDGKYLSEGMGEMQLSALEITANRMVENWQEEFKNWYKKEKFRNAFDAQEEIRFKTVIGQDEEVIQMEEGFKFSNYFMEKYLKRSESYLWKYYFNTKKTGQSNEV
jgi:hypothetical protein